MLDRIQYRDIKKWKRYIPFDIHYNSKLYYDEDVIYKILYYLKNNLKEILEYINKLDLDELIQLIHIVYDNEIIIGYSFRNYREYKSLRKYKKRSLELKKQDCFKIVKSFNILNDNNLIYKDFHCGNVLLNDKTNDLKICDLDSVIINDSLEKKYIQLRRAFMLALGYLYNLDYRDINIVLKSNVIINENEDINRVICSSDKINVEDIYYLIEKLNLELIPKDRNKIKAKSYILTNDQYYNF